MSRWDHLNYNTYNYVDNNNAKEVNLPFQITLPNQKGLIPKCSKFIWGEQMSVK